MHDWQLLFRTVQIKTIDLAITADIRMLNDLKTKLSQQLAELNNRQNQPTGEIMISIQSKGSEEGHFTVSYLEGNAGWSPGYDLRANDISTPVELQYYASVFQNTGEDWNNVKIGFSSANPEQSATVPEIKPWYLDFLQATNAAPLNVQGQGIIMEKPEKGGYLYAKETDRHQ